MKTNSFHFRRRLRERFDMGVRELENITFETITRFSTRRYDFPALLSKFKNHSRTQKYLVSEELNMVIPLGVNDVKITCYHL